MEARSYPFARLPRVARGELARLRAIARALPADLGAAVRHESAQLFGAALRVQPRAPELLTAAQASASLRAGCVALRLELAGDARARGLLLELSIDDATALCDRVLGGDGSAPAPLGRGLDEVSLGVLGYAAARLCALTGGTLRLRAIEQERAALEAVLDDGPVLVWPLALALGDVALGGARALIPDGAAGVLQRTATSREAEVVPRVLDVLPVIVCAHAGCATLTRGELDALGVRDVVIPDRCRIARGAGGGFSGELELHAAGCRTGFSCRWDGARLTLEHRVHIAPAPGSAAPSRGERTMSDTKRISTTGAASELAADTPVELCLELARFTLPLRELAALRPGEVLETGSAVGAACTLSASGRALARGELVDVDGELGIRVLELLR